MYAVKSVIHDWIARGQVVRFAELPQPYQDAIIHYMSVDGEAWAVEDGWLCWEWGGGAPCDKDGRNKVMRDINKYRHLFVERYGYRMFGVGVVSSEEMLNGILSDQELRNDGSDFINEDQKLEYEIPTWPVILASVGRDELMTLQDGWHRVTKYIHLKMSVPYVWYA
jgi:hypothetical protein